MAKDPGCTRPGEWMQTFTGRRFFPEDPRPEEIDITDIASALSKLCRFGGHCLRFYSVAEHAVLVARSVPDELKLTALLHDASEAYLVDIPRPVKPSLKGYYEIEDLLMRAIAGKFGAQWPLPPEVKNADNAILRDEREQNMAGMDVISSIWGDPLPALGVRLQFWTPDHAMSEFIKAFYTYANTTDRHVA